MIAGDLQFKNIFYFDFRVLEGEEETAFLDAVKDVREVKKKYEVKRKVLKTKRHPADGIDKSKDDEIAKLKAELLAGSKKPEEEPEQQETKPVAEGGEDVKEGKCRYFVGRLYTSFFGNKKNLLQLAKP